MRGVSSRRIASPAASCSSSANDPSIDPSVSSSRAPAGSRARAASACFARNASTALCVCSVFPCTAREAISSSASVTPAMADTTTTSGAGRCDCTMDMACAIAAPFASEAPPNLWICRGRDVRGMSAGPRRPRIRRPGA